MKTTNKAVEALKEKGIKFDAPRLELAKKDENGIPQSTGKHLLTILRDERRNDIKEFTSGNSFKEVTGIRYWFDEDGVEKYYDVPLFAKGTTDVPDYRIERFSQFNEGDHISLEYVKKGSKGYIEFEKVEGNDLPTVQIDESNNGASPSVDESEDISETDLPF